MFAEIIALSGIKSEVQTIDKVDIQKLILTAFNGISLHEIYKAFELERYGQYESKTPSYDKFNADYVSNILNKYKAWKKSMLITHNIKAPDMLPDAEPYSDRSEAFKYLEVWKKNGTLQNSPNINCVYDFLFEQKVLPKHDKDFKIKYLKLAKTYEILTYRKDNYGQSEEQITAGIDLIKSNDSREETRRTVRRFIIQDYFKDLIERKIDLETEI
jgi:hypothetical protein